MSRRCGDCQLCCKLLPVREINKTAGQKCQHQKFGKGCAIYERCPPSCRLWSCAWLTGQFDGRRPDRSGYVIDIMPDYITLRPHDGTPENRVPITQVWLDPAKPDAWKDQDLLAHLGKKSALLRYNSREAAVLVSPALSGLDGWFLHDTSTEEEEHSPAEIQSALAGSSDHPATDAAK